MRVDPRAPAYALFAEDSPPGSWVNGWTLYAMVSYSPVMVNPQEVVVMAEYLIGIPFPPHSSIKKPSESLRRGAASAFYRYLTDLTTDGRAWRELAREMSVRDPRLLIENFRGAFTSKDIDLTFDKQMSRDMGHYVFRMDLYTVPIDRRRVLVGG